MRSSSRVKVLFCLFAAVAFGYSSLSSSFQLSCTYDDNPFLLSPGDRSAFLHSVNPERFPYSTLDDLDVMLAGGLSWSYSEQGNIDLKLRAHQFLANWEKSYSVSTLTLEYGTALFGDLGLSWTWLPSYLIRYYRNPGSGTDYIPCRFAEHLTTLELKKRLGPMEFTPFYRFELDDYIADFNHYDTKAHRPGIATKWRPVPNLRIDAGYEFKLAQAQGPVPDLSYHQHQLDAAILSWPSKLRRLGFRAGFGFEQRTYTTRNSPEIDPEHVDRQDRTERISLELRYRLRQIVLAADYSLEWREVKSPYRPQIEEVKDYRQNRIGLSITLNSGRWRK
ncbi:MAG: hypothetical protein ABIK44_00305 [candidate division WOR-3 bacterium]